MTDRFRDYDPFAWLYANYWGSQFHEQIGAVLDNLLLNELPSGSQVLDLCCGDGRVTEQLIDRGFRVTGLDGSAELLKFARERVPEAKFHLADARDFKLPEQFHAAVSTFDSLNHVTSVADLALVFANVCSCLRPGGLFGFDLNDEEAYGSLWSNLSAIVDENVVSVAQGSYDATTRVATCEITLMRRDDEGWVRSDFNLQQYCHPANQVEQALLSAGFQTVKKCSAEELGMRGNIGSYRTFFLARR
jgi:SAM-dependent methyltransferase